MEIRMPDAWWIIAIVAIGFIVRGFLEVYWASYDREHVTKKLGEEKNERSG